MFFFVPHPMIQKMNRYIETMHGGKNSLWLQFRHGMGIVFNYLRYEATISDYFELRFYEKTRREKSKYITSPQALRFASFVDSLEKIVHYNSKAAMYKALGAFIKRDQLFSKECSFKEFTRFASRHPFAIYKPDKEDCGHGVEKWDMAINGNGGVSKVYFFRSCIG